MKVGWLRWLQNCSAMQVIEDKAYRQLSMKYHPDKVAHLGAEFKRVAEEKMKEINAAYDYFRKKFERQQ